MADKFIEEFGELLKKHNVSNINGMKYENDGIDEYVYIFYKNGYVKQVCVTFDSLKAMIVDIIKQGGLE